jgi:hypothetical protein
LKSTAGALKGGYRYWGFPVMISEFGVESGAMSETLKRILLTCLTLLIASCVCASLVSLATAVLFLR